MIKSRRHFYDFGPFRLIEDEGVLLRDGEIVPLKPKAFDTLVQLVQNSPRLVSKEDLMHAVWPDSVVEENNLSQQISALRKALGEGPQDQRYIETISKRGYRFTADVTEGWEMAPPQSATIPEAQTTEIEAAPLALVPDRPEPGQKKPAWAGKFGPLTRWGAVVLVLVAIGLIATFAIAKYENSRSVHAVPQPRRSLAILKFKNLTGDQEMGWLSTGLAEMFRTELAAGHELRIIPGENIARMQRELGLADVDSLSADTLTRIRKNIGADLVLLGSYTIVRRGSNDQIRLDIRVQDTVTGEITSSESRVGTQSTVLAIVSQSATLLRKDLGIATEAAADGRPLRESLPRDPEAQRLYAEGVAKLRLLDAAGAVPILEKAAARDGRSPLIHSALSEAWSVLGYKRKARDEAGQAFNLGKHIRQEELLEIEARYRELARQWDRAIDIYKSLWTVFPDNVEYALRLASDQTEAGKGKDALATITAMRKLLGPTEDPRIDLAEAATAEALGDFRREYAAAKQAAEAASSSGAKLLMANALLRECWALDSMGDRKQALGAARQAKDLFAAAGDEGGKARAVKNIADVLDDDGDHDEGRKSYEAALKMFRKIGNQRGVAITLNNLAHALRNQGDLGDARKRFEESLAISHGIGDEAGEALAFNGLAILMGRQEGDLLGAQKMYEAALKIRIQENDKSRAAAVLGNLAINLQDQGRLAEAKLRFEESGKMLSEIGDRPGVARTLGNIGELLRDEGDLAGAKKNFLEQLQEAREIVDNKQRAYALYGVGEVLMLEGDLNGALTKHIEALKLRAGLDEQGLAAESRLAIGETLVALGDGKHAAIQFEDALREFHNEKESEEETQAEASLALCFLLEGNAPRATRALNSAWPEVSKIADISARISTEITLATVRARLGDRSRARAALQSAQAEAGRYGYRLHQLEAALPLADLEAATTTRATRLRAIHQEAKAEGFGLIALKAEAHLRQ